MGNANIWQLAKNASINISPEIICELNLWFDKRISSVTKNELINFITWTEQNFSIPVPLSIDFEYKHYLLTRDKKRVGYLFYWSEFSDYPNLNESDNIPCIRLPVRTEKWTLEEILTSLIQGLTCYYTWATNNMTEEYSPDDKTVETILQEYLNRIKS